MELFDKKSLQKIKNLLTEDTKVVITAHMNPDGDALGSSLALYNYLKDKTICKVVLPNNIPDTFKWMPSIDEVLIYNEENQQIVNQADVIFLLDFNCSQRVDKMQKVLEESKACKVMIDHHPDPQEGLCEFVFSDPKAAANCELMWLFFKGMDFKINLDSVKCLFTGLITDTGCFAFNSVTKQTFEVAAQLSEFGVDRAEIVHHIYDSYSTGRMQLMGYVLSKKMVVFPEYHAAYISLTKAEAEQFDYKVGDTEGFVNLPLSIKDVQFSGFFMERDGIIRISLRSKGDFRVNDIAAKYFNGGGHANAAGGKSYKPLEEIVERFVKILPKVTKSLQK